MNFIIKRAREEEREREREKVGITFPDVGRAKFGLANKDPRWISGFRTEDLFFISL